MLQFDFQVEAYPRSSEWSMFLEVWTLPMVTLPKESVFIDFFFFPKIQLLHLNKVLGNKQPSI